MMGNVRGCHAVKFDSCNNLLSSVHTILVIILWYVRLNIIKNKTLLLFHDYFLTAWICEFNIVSSALFVIFAVQLNVTWTSTIQLEFEILTSWTHILQVGVNRINISHYLFDWLATYLFVIGKNWLFWNCIAITWACIFHKTCTCNKQYEIIIIFVYWKLLSAFGENYFCFYLTLFF